ncbi:MAG TPA: hypothetical protein VK524_32420, partial [Polyangiaceae bacterium]|nr:hypothetical protein [Polyangiaceae bacterium]
MKFPWGGLLILCSAGAAFSCAADAYPDGVGNDPGELAARKLKPPKDCSPDSCAARKRGKKKRCAPVCNDTPFAQAVPIAALSLPNTGEGAHAVSSDGSVILYQGRQQPAAFCAFDQHLMALRQPAGDYAITDIAPQLAGLGLAVQPAALSGDGSSIVFLSMDLRRYVLTSRTGTRIELADSSAFDAINAALPAGAHFSQLALSGNGRIFVYDIAPASGTGIHLYESQRASPSDAFPAGAPLPDELQSTWMTSGISYDGLTLFQT